MGCRPDPLLTVSEWADAHRYLSPRASAEPGRYRTDRTPYMRAIMDALSPSHPARRVVVMKSAQVGFTEGGNCWIGYVIHHAPGPMLAVQPTVELAKRFSRQRIEPLIAESPALRERVKPSRAARCRQHGAVEGVPGGAADHHRRQQRGGPALDAGALPVPGRGRCLSAVGRRGGRSGCARRSADAHLLVAFARFCSARRRRSTASRGSSGNTRHPTSGATSCRARIASTCSGSSSSGCAGTRASPRPHIMICEACDGRIEEHHKTAMLQAGEWRATAEAQRSRHHRLPSLGALFAGRLVLLGRHRPDVGGGAGHRRGQAQLQERRAGPDLGRDRRGAGLAAALRAARAAGRSARCRAAGCS